MNRAGKLLLLLALLAATGCGLAGDGGAAADAARRATAAEVQFEMPSARRLPFLLRFRGELSPYSWITTTALPGESFEIEADSTRWGANFEASAEAGELEQLGPERWRFTAPDTPGAHLCVEVVEISSEAVACLQVLVMRPYAGERVVNGYRIGRYGMTPHHGNPAYTRPRGLVEVTPLNRNLPVSPHFRLGEFMAKQEADWPRYLVLRTRLLLKLEMLREELREAGVEAPRLVLMSAYRTPYYNASIGNTTTYSRHAYGDAADIFIDADRDGRMDDLNGDGALTEDDARWLYDLVSGLEREDWYAPFVGGLHVYGPKAHRGSFVHVDTRGRRARW